MKVYEAIFNESVSEGVYGISLVENPAMEDHWITLSEQKAEIQFSAVNDEKQLLLGAVLIPNKKVYRNVDGNEFYITFTEQTIGKLAHNFLKKGHQNNSSEEHNLKLNDVSFVESWQVENPEVDKSALYGKSYEKGTWVTMAHVSKETYEKAKNGTFKGFSIDGLLQLKEINTNTNINMTKQDFIDAFKAIFSQEPKEVEVKAEVVEPVQDPTVDVAGLEALTKEDLTEVLTQFKADQDAKFEAFKAELKADEKVLEDKDAKILELETKLSKEPETEAIKPKAEFVQAVNLTKQGRILQAIRNN